MPMRKTITQLSLLTFLIFHFSICQASPYDDSDDNQDSSDTPSLSAESEQLPPGTPAIGNKQMAARLQQVLVAYQAAINNPWPTLPESDRILKPGSKSKDILVLRKRLIYSNDLAKTADHGGTYYDKSLADAVKVFQTRHGLKADGVVGSGTRAELNVPPDVRAKQLAATLQRWAALSPNLGHRYILVNIPDYQVHLVDNDNEVLNIKAIVGKPDWPTPELGSRVTRIMFNPPWNVPPGIAKRDIAPKMLQDPSYLSKNGIHVYASEEEGSERLSPSDVDWEAVAEGNSSYQLRQESGSKSALGLVKFEFPNEKSVYLHDTPAKQLFTQEKRDLSHGCVRLEKPFSLVTYLTQDDPHMTPEHIQSIIDTQHATPYALKNPIPIFLAYMTAWVSDNGTVNFRDDIYHLDTPDPDAPPPNVNNDAVD